MAQRWVTYQGVTVGMGSNGDGNTAVKWKRDKQCFLVTLLTACCCTCTDSKLCSIGLEMDENQTFLYLRLVVLINTLCSVSTFTSVILWEWGGMGAMFTGTVGDWVQFLSPCRPLLYDYVAIGRLGVGRGAGCGTGVVGGEKVCKCNNFRIKN